MWTVISRIRAGAPRPGRPAREQKAPLCPHERGVAGSAGRVPPRGEGPRVQRMGPLCTWRADFGVRPRVREESREAEGRGQRQRDSAEGRELTGLSSKSTADVGNIY